MRPTQRWRRLQAFFGEHKIAGDWYVRAAEVQPTKIHHRISAAKEFRQAREINLARRQLELVLSALA